MITLFVPCLLSGRATGYFVIGAGDALEMAQSRPSPLCAGRVHSVGVGWEVRHNATPGACWLACGWRLSRPALSSIASRIRLWLCLFLFCSATVAHVQFEGS